MQHPAKVELRRKYRRVRDALSETVRKEYAHRMAEHAEAAVPAGDALVAGYSPMKTEADCLPLLRRIAGGGHPLALPIISDDGYLIFKGWHPDDSLVAGPLGILQPTAGPDVTPTVLLVPLLAFDAHGYRLGYGGGYYDRTLAMLTKRAPTVAIGIAFDEQEAPALPIERHDVPMSVILTQSGLRRYPLRA